MRAQIERQRETWARKGQWKGRDWLVLLGEFVIRVRKDEAGDNLGKNGLVLRQ